MNLSEALRADSMVFWISDFDWSQIDHGLSPATSASMTPFSMTASKKFRNIGAWQSATYLAFLILDQFELNQKSGFDLSLFTWREFKNGLFNRELRKSPS